MNDFLSSFFRDGPFMPHGHCYLWTPALLWLHVVSDALIVFSYFTIPVTLIYFVRKRHDLRFGWMFLCFAVFIIACGTTHLMEIWNVWHANYWLSGGVKAVTAMASVPTAFLLTRLVSPALKLPSMADLERLNAALEQEVSTRSKAEETVRAFNAELESRVQERTTDLRRQIAEREQAQEAARQSELRERTARGEAERVSRVKDEFLSTLSHELRTPLNAIYGWSQILQTGTVNPKEMAQGISTIERNARAQKQIIDDLLDMSAIISGKVRMDVHRLDLAPVVDAAIASMRPAAEAKGIRLQAVLDPQAGPVSGDTSRLQQIFWNLLSNAIKFTPKGGRVQVLLERVNSHLEVSVIDSGEGITAEFLPHVFERFRQADASISRHHGGLGLGLAIVKQLVELHGGTVRVSSAGPGQGSTFVVALPLMAVHPGTAAPGAPRHEHPAVEGSALLNPHEGTNLAGVKVLVIDDEEDARVLVQRLLENFGASVRTAGSVAEAIAEVTAEKPDVLVSDIGMPGENGYELIRRVRGLGPGLGGNIPALALTAFARSEDRMKAVRAGFQMHIAKPVEAAELLTMVASLAGRSG